MGTTMIINLLFTALFGVLAFMWANAVKRIEVLEENTLRKSDLDALRNQLAGEHHSNDKRLESIEKAQEQSADRIYDLVKERIK